MSGISRFKIYVIWAYFYFAIIYVICQYGFWTYTITPYLWDVYDMEIVQKDPYKLQYVENGKVITFEESKEHNLKTMLYGSISILENDKKGDSIKVAFGKKNKSIYYRIDWISFDEFNAISIINFLFIMADLIASIFNKKWKRKEKQKESIVNISKGQ